jgi:hypothetical protein
LVFDGFNAKTKASHEANEQKAIARLIFILKCTNQSTGYSALRQDARLLWDRLSKPREDVLLNTDNKTVARRFFVPADNYGTYYSALDRILGRCKDLDVASRELEKQKQLTDLIRNVGIKCLNAISLMHKEVLPNEKTYDKMINMMDQVSKVKQEMTVSVVTQS